MIICIFHTYIVCGLKFTSSGLCVKVKTHFYVFVKLFGGIHSELSSFTVEKEALFFVKSHLFPLSR